jgi:cobalt-zinc-cadmium efflux system membrane fusion protein
MNIFFTKKLITKSLSRSILLSTFMVLFSSFPLFASEDDEEHEEITDRITLTQAYAENAGIKDSIARAGEISQTLTLYGKTENDASQVSQVRARFAGMIRKLSLNIGDKVTKGEIIAEIESSSSLKTYTVIAPISGSVTARFANENELSDQQALLTITNSNKLWLELQVFPSQRKKVAIGDKVIVSSVSNESEFSIKYLLPSDNNQPFTLARVLIDNEAQQLSPGLLLSAEVVTNRQSVDLAIENRAMQSVGGVTVAFIKTAYGYQMRPIQVGLTDGSHSEVLTGLTHGETYALENSYLLKAELEKSLAADDDDH